jgi:hypothetical protein
VVLSFVRTALVAVQVFFTRKFNTTVLGAQAFVGLVYLITKCVVVYTQGYGTDRLPLVILFIASGYSLLEIIMAVIGRTTNMERREETAPLIELFRTDASTVPADHLAASDSKFTVFNNVTLHYKFHAAPSLASPSINGSTGVDADDRPLVVLIHGVGGCAETMSEVVAQLPVRCGLSVAAFDRPGFGLTDRNARASTVATSGMRRGASMLYNAAVSDTLPSAGLHSSASLGTSTASLPPTMVCVLFDLNERSNRFADIK